MLRAAQITLLAAGSAIISSQAFASYCFLPDAPRCATSGYEFDDQDGFDSCRRKMQSYRSEVETHLQCVQQEYSDAVKKFNRKAGG